MRFMLTVPAVLLTAAPLVAQSNDPGKLGINFSVGNMPNIGVSWRVSPAVTLRPAVSFFWNKNESAFGGNETTQWAVSLDILFRSASWDRVTSYFGVGGGYGNINGSAISSGSLWAARALMGARIRIVERVWIFGEAGFQYVSGEGLIGKEAGLGTFPLGLTIFLK